MPDFCKIRSPFFFIVVLLMNFITIAGMSQSISDYIEKLEHGDTREDFERAFREMITAFKSGKLSFSNDEVMHILEIARQKPYAENLLPDVYGWAGTMFADGRMDEAIRYFMESADLYGKQNKKLAQALSCFQVALIQHKAENYEEAAEYYEKTLALAGDSLDHRTRINCYNGFALIRRHQKQYDAAIRDFRNAYRIAEKNSDTAWMGILAGNIGSIHARTEKYDSALYFYFRNLAFIRKTPEFENEIETYAHLGRIYVLRKNYAMGKIYLDSAVNIIRDRKIMFNDFFNPMDYINESYALLYASTGDYRRAFEYHKKFHQIAQDKQANVNGRSLRQLQSTYTFNQKQQELELLKKINEANLLVIRQQKYIGIAFAFIILLLGSLAFIGFRTGMHRKRVNQKLYTSNTELERLNTIKDKLFSVISHDLRGPVKNLSSVLALFREGHLSQEEFVQLSAKLGHQLEVSGNALENLLHWAKAQLSNHKTDPEKIVVADIAGKVAQQLKESIETKKLQFTNELEPQLVAWADKHQVEIILRNLVANAVKFTREGGAIKITGKGVDDHVEVSVEDSGIGMTAPAIQNLFQPGRHFTTSGTNQEKGTGIGLLITKEMVANNGGSIQVDSSRNRGTRFTFTLPLKER